MSLADYLAKKYLTADSKSEKKGKKRKRKEASGFSIADDDTLGWENPKSGRDDEDTPITVATGSAEFRKAKTNNWTTVGSTAPSSAQLDQSAEAAEADAIISSAAAEREAAREQEDEAPEIVDEDGVTTMQSGALAGLQTAAQVAAAVDKKRRRERKRAEEAKEGGPGGETIYRDASGRIINVAMKRAEARKQAEEEERKKREAQEAAKGDVQRLEKEKRRQDLQDAKLMTVARYADDVEMNQELKERDRWNDPAAGFIAEKKQGKSVSGRPLYKGAAWPNRYGIKPGHKWDGVERSNGFEKKWFEARNRQNSRKELEHMWQMDE
ncbi:hypothetical protein NA57DRAFT_77458 [Rhizodiscina lignyota]|uniref:Pre-mRNA-splicing factor CWC26 n=1 Tax=Rhizodiscina lignyota TaxID=1504668 RepID=A0A9P4IDU6_9PEZI|nr:hypothetical protein NA57DRAFT_77458 [Rhizodiscina lignyota]